MRVNLTRNKTQSRAPGSALQDTGPELSVGRQAAPGSSGTNRTVSARIEGCTTKRASANTPGPLNPTPIINVGETRTEGVELAVTGRLRPNWQISRGYVCLDASLQGNDFVRLA